MAALSRSDGRIVAWASGAGQRPETDEQVLQRIRDLGGVVDDWDERATVKIPGNGRVATVSAPIEKVLGWLAPLLSPLLSRLAPAPSAAGAGRPGGASASRCEYANFKWKDWLIVAVMAIVFIKLMPTGKLPGTPALGAAM